MSKNKIQVDNLPHGWTIAILENLLDYVQPTNHIVSTTDYNDSYKTPVLTPGKSFILGYTNETEGIFNRLPVIIFDDFTTAIKWVNFPFKVKSSAMKILVPTHSDVNMKFTYYFMETLQINTDTHKRYWISVGAKSLIPLPPLNEQNRIVQKLDELLSELEKSKEQLQTSLEQLKVYRQSILKSAFEGKLTGKKVDNGILPLKWQLVELKEIVEVNPKLPNKDKIENDLQVQFVPMKLVEEIVNVVHLSEIRQFKDVLKGSYTPFINDDIIFAKVTPCMENGKIAIAKNLKNGIGFGSSEFHVLRISNKVLKEYVFYFIVQDRFRNEAQHAMTGAVGLRRVPKQFIENHLIPLPPIDEQQLIINELESKLAVCDKIEETIAASLQKADTLKQSLLQKAFEGKLVEQNPNDEPASVLLEKIKREREELGKVKKAASKPLKRITEMV